MALKSCGYQTSTCCTACVTLMRACCLPDPRLSAGLIALFVECHLLDKWPTSCILAGREHAGPGSASYESTYFLSTAASSALNLHRLHLTSGLVHLLLQTPMTQQTPAWLPHTRNTAPAASTSTAGLGTWVTAAVASDSRGMAAAVAADRTRTAGVALNIADVPGTDLLSSKVCPVSLAAWRHVVQVSDSSYMRPVACGTFTAATHICP